MATPPAAARTISKGGRPSGSTSYDPVSATAFGEVVREMRLAQGIAQEALALRAELDRSYLGHLERGQKQPSLAVILKLAKALGCSATKLMEKVELQLSRKSSK